MLHINGNVVTLADYGLAQVARPVVSRTKDVLRKRNARKVAAEAREQARKLSIVCSNGFVIRPIK
jgi:hypothetical protein